MRGSSSALTGGPRVNAPRRRTRSWLAAVLLMGALTAVAGEDGDDFDLQGFSDIPSEHTVEHPTWFKRSLLDLREDLARPDLQAYAAAPITFRLRYI